MRRLAELAAKERRRVVGLISGTSADGVDALLVELEGSGPRTRFAVLAFCTAEIPEEVRGQVFALFRPDASLDALCQVNFALGEVFARAALQVIAQAGLEPGEIDLIGSHGQTVRHLPGGRPPSTLQIGEPAVIARRTGIVTIADFRPADMAAGGQGAPLVPLADYLLFAHPEKGRLLLNIGGIANVTLLPARAGQVRAFDLGPGNMLIDGAVAHFTQGRERCDGDGARARRGQVDQALLARLMQHPFLGQEPPKSTGREEFGEAFLQGLLQTTALGEDDLVATLTAFAARSMGEGIRRFALEGGDFAELWVAGGGVHNPLLMEGLRRELPSLKIASLAELGFNPDAREALAFAVLANQTLMGHTGNLPSATGAKQPVILGKIALP